MGEETTDYAALTAAAYGFDQGVKKGRQDAEAELVEGRQQLKNLEEWVVASGASLAPGISEAVEARLQGRAADVVHERDEARQQAERLDGTLRHVGSIARQSPEQPLLATILAVIEAALADPQPAEAGGEG